jgi:hypothetical protein
MFLKSKFLPDFKCKTFLIVFSTNFKADEEPYVRLKFYKSQTNKVVI